MVPKCIRALCHIDTDCHSVPLFPEVEVDNHFMGGPGHAHHNSMERRRGNTELGKVVLWLEAECVIRTQHQCAGCPRLPGMDATCDCWSVNKCWRISENAPPRERTACQDTQGTEALASSGSVKAKMSQRTDSMWIPYRFRCRMSDTSGGYKKLRVRQHRRQLMEVLRCRCAWGCACV